MNHPLPHDGCRYNPATYVWCATEPLVCRHIKASSPRLNILIIAGFMLVPPSAVLRGLIISKEYYGISASVATALCQVELHVTNTALTVAVATLFAKNWRIYRIFHNQQMQMLSWILSDNGLLLMVLLMTLPFVSLLAIWQIVDPVVSCQRTFVVRLLLLIWFVAAHIVVVSGLTLSRLSCRVPRGC